MKKELLSCINNVIKRQNNEERIKTEREEAIRRQKELLESRERARLLNEIHEFFKGFYPNRGFMFPLRWLVPREENDDLEFEDDHMKDYKFKRIKEFEGIKFTYLDFGYDHYRNELYINGTSTDPFDKDADYRYSNYPHQIIPYKNWNNERLNIFVKALPWIEDYIAKQYGCSQQ